MAEDFAGDCKKSLDGTITDRKINSETNVKTGNTRTTSTAEATEANAEITVRKAVHKDFDAVFALEKQNSLRPYPHKIMQEIFENYTVFIAASGGKTIGYAALSIVFEDAEIINIAVEQKLRGRGTGGALISALIDESRNKGAKRILLEVESTNSAALKLYQRFGFVQISKREKYYGENSAVIMQLDI